MELRRRLLSQIGGKIKIVEMGQFTPSEDVRASQFPISHNLGSTPDFVVVTANEFAAQSDMTVAYIANSYCSKSNMIASNISTNGIAAYRYSLIGRDTARDMIEAVLYTKFLHQSTFEVPYYSSGDMLKAGITYHYVIGKFE